MQILAWLVYPVIWPRPDLISLSGALKPSMPIPGSAADLDRFLDEDGSGLWVKGFRVWG